MQQLTRLLLILLCTGVVASSAAAECTRWAPVHRRSAVGATPRGDSRGGRLALREHTAARPLRRAVLAMLVVPFVLSGVPQPMAREAAAASHPAEAAARFRTRIEEAPLPEETVYRRALQFTVGVHVPGGYAAGVVLTPGGKVLTNHHVVENGFDHVLLPEGRQVRATLIADGPEHDLALLQLEEVSDLATAELAGRVEDGQTIYALGFPDRQPYQLTRSSAELDVQCPRFPDCVSAPRGFLRPGNSGGPLLDHQAEWVGVNSGIDGESGTAISLHPEHVQEFLRNNLPAAGQAPAPDRPSFAPAPPAPTEQEALRRRQYRQRPPLQQ